eukprot:5745549-Pyramimonas_sp.AAC.1
MDIGLKCINLRLARMQLALLSNYWSIFSRGWEASQTVRSVLAPVVANTGECVAVLDLFGGARGLASTSFILGFILASALCCGCLHGCGGRREAARAVEGWAGLAGPRRHRPRHGRRAADDHG